MFLSLKKEPSKICLSETRLLGPLSRIAAGWLALSIFPVVESKITWPLTTESGAIQESLNEEVKTFVVFCKPLSCHESTQNKSPPFCPVNKILKSHFLYEKSLVIENVKSGFGLPIFT